MRQNRRKHARISSIDHKVIALTALVLLPIMMGAIGNLAIQSSITTIGRDISRLESELKALRPERMRAEARWSACTRPEQLELALSRHGLNMELAKGERIVSLKGRSFSGTLDSPATEVASYAPASRAKGN